MIRLTSGMIRSRDRAPEYPAFEKIFHHAMK
jgi:hypothetical protein